MPSREGPRARFVFAALPAWPCLQRAPRAGLCCLLLDLGLAAGSVPLNSASRQGNLPEIICRERIGIKGNVSSLPPCPAASPGLGCVQSKFTFSWASREGSGLRGARGGGQMMALGLLFLTVLATLTSCQDPEGDLDTYWSGTAPICVGGCKGRHKELKRSQCGNGSCCWLGYKSFCRVNCGRPEADFNSVVHGNDWWVGSVVRYSCRPGFLLLGDPASACQSDGRWTPKPSCLRE
ncbi:uncharacterized protein LOC128799118 [Vidua chalybeata]|uniref:uncharacterized protein LOC128799118 n=1 Tax=Vidua chalybeata TaxID=81927 RepID=UPI0023A80166|nr:uncharacterized protein LOC128799118 [Vidua chalybeata]